MTKTDVIDELVNNYLHPMKMVEATKLSHDKILGFLSSPPSQEDQKFAQIAYQALVRGANIRRSKHK